MKDHVVKFILGQIVYSIVNGMKGQITGILFRSAVSYAVTWSEDLEEKWHFDYELSAEKTFETELNENIK